MAHTFIFVVLSSFLDFELMYPVVSSAFPAGRLLYMSDPVCPDDNSWFFPLGLSLPVAFLISADGSFCNLAGNLKPSLALAFHDFHLMGQETLLPLLSKYIQYPIVSQPLPCYHLQAAIISNRLLTVIPYCVPCLSGVFSTQQAEILENISQIMLLFTQTL